MSNHKIPNPFNLLQYDPNVQGVADIDMFDKSRKISMAKVRATIGTQIWMANRSESDNEDDNVVVPTS